jgi:hypothetical protein
MERGNGGLKVTEAELREAYQDVMVRNRGARAACPAPEAIQVLARREGPEATRLATLDHVMGCRECRAELDLLRSIEEAGARSGAAPRAGRPRWIMPAALAATLLVAVGLGRLALRSPEDATRSGPGSAARVELAAPGSRCLPARRRLRLAAGRGCRALPARGADESGDLAIEAGDP